MSDLFPATSVNEDVTAGQEVTLTTAQRLKHQRH